MDRYSFLRLASVESLLGEAVSFGLLNRAQAVQLLQSSCGQFKHPGVGEYLDKYAEIRLLSCAVGRGVSYSLGWENFTVGENDDNLPWKEYVTKRKESASLLPFKIEDLAVDTDSETTRIGSALTNTMNFNAMRPDFRLADYYLRICKENFPGYKYIIQNEDHSTAMRMFDDVLRLAYLMTLLTVVPLDRFVNLVVELGIVPLCTDFGRHRSLNYDAAKRSFALGVEELESKRFDEFCKALRLQRGNLPPIRDELIPEASHFMNEVILNPNSYGQTVLAIAKSRSATDRKSPFGRPIPYVYAHPEGVAVGGEAWLRMAEFLDSLRPGNDFLSDY